MQGRGNTLLHDSVASAPATPCSNSNFSRGVCPTCGHVVGGSNRRPAFSTPRVIVGTPRSDRTSGGLLEAQVWSNRREGGSRTNLLPLAEELKAATLEDIRDRICQLQLTRSFLVRPGASEEDARDARTLEIKISTSESLLKDLVACGAQSTVDPAAGKVSAAAMNGCFERTVQGSLCCREQEHNTDEDCSDPDFYQPQSSGLLQQPSNTASNASAANTLQCADVADVADEAGSDADDYGDVPFDIVPEVADDDASEISPAAVGSSRSPVLGCSLPSNQRHQNPAGGYFDTVESSSDKLPKVLDSQITQDNGVHHYLQALMANTSEVAGGQRSVYVQNIEHEVHYDWVVPRGPTGHHATLGRRSLCASPSQNAQHHPPAFFQSSHLGVVPAVQGPNERMSQNAPPWARFFAPWAS